MSDGGELIDIGRNRVVGVAFYSFGNENRDSRAWRRRGWVVRNCRCGVIGMNHAVRLGYQTPVDCRIGGIVGGVR